VTRRSGLGIVDVAILETLDHIGANANRPFMKSARAVAHLDEEYGVGWDTGYEALMDMARPWRMPLHCVSFHGNYGSPDYPGSAPQYTEARLSAVGELALAAERGETGAVPIGLINGNTYSGGVRPPYQPAGMIDALTRVLSEPTAGRAKDAELVRLVGPPSFPGGCDVRGYLKVLAAGRRVKLQCSAVLTPAEELDRRGRPGWVVSRLPPGPGGRAVVEGVANRVNRRPWANELPELDRRTRIPVAAIDDLSAGETTRLVFILAPGGDLEDLRKKLLATYGVGVRVDVQLPAPLPEYLRGWVASHDEDDLASSLAQLREALHP